MKVSIITVAFNAAETIEATLQSIRSQTHGSIEYIVIDGGSTDGTLDILQSHKGIIDVLVSEPDKGIYDAMNKGLARCSGELIGILNSDDTYADADVLADVVQAAQDNGADACYADLQYVDRYRPSRVVRHWKSGAFRKNAFRYGWMPPHPSFFLKRDAYAKFGGFRTELRGSADYELMLRMLYKEGLKTTYLPRVIVHMKTGGQSNVSLRNRLHSNREDRLAWEMNDLEPLWFTFWWKPLRKLAQFIRLPF